MVTQISTIKMRQGTTAEWAASNRILEPAEWGYDVDLQLAKLGNGVSTWAQLKPALFGAASDIPGFTNAVAVAVDAEIGTSITDLQTTVATNATTAANATAAVQSNVSTLATTVNGHTTSLATLNGASRGYVVESVNSIPPGLRANDFVVVPLVAAPVTYIHNLSFDTALAVGAAFTVAESGLTNTTGATVGNPVIGSGTNAKSLKVAGTTQITPYKDIATPATDYRISVSCRFNSVPANVTTPFLRTFNASFFGPLIRITNGKFGLYINGATPVATSATLGPVSGTQVWHFELDFSLSGGDANLKIWAPGNTTTTPSETLSGTGLTFQIATLARLQVGIMTAQAAGMDVDFDNLRISERTQPQHPVTT